MLMSGLEQERAGEIPRFFPAYDFINIMVQNRVKQLPCFLEEES